MRLAARLCDTTLGDLLGSLYRRRISGVVELTESRGPCAGNRHRIHLADGCVTFVETPSGAPPIGEILRQRGLVDGPAHRRLTLLLARGEGRLAGELLVEECMISVQVIDAALRHQLRARLDALFRVPDAAVSFHVAGGRPRGRAKVPLSPNEVLAGRPRARDARAGRDPRGAEAASPRATRPASGLTAETPRQAALRVLGLCEEATSAEVRRAFRVLAKEAHPDLHARATEAEKRVLEARFAVLSAAYHQLA